MSQTWFINGRHMRREEMMKYRASLKEKSEETQATLEKTPENPFPEVPVSTEETALPSIQEVEGKGTEIDKEVVENIGGEPSEEDEYKELKSQKAWLKPALKARYAELKAKFN